MSGQPIQTVHLFPVISKALIDLLTKLNEDEWKRKTALPGRTVKDLAAHILDASLRRLSLCRDRHSISSPHIACHEDLVKHIQEMNDEGISYFKKISPRLLISLLLFSEQEVFDYFSTLDPAEKAPFSVSWAGEAESPNWFDIAREYTEKWHHQTQIRLAVEKPGIDSENLIYPVIETFLRGLPHAYRTVKREKGSTLMIVITGSGSGTWHLASTGSCWELEKGPIPHFDASITISDSLFWQFFTDTVTPETALSGALLSGDPSLTSPFFAFKAVMR